MCFTEVSDVSRLEGRLAGSSCSYYCSKRYALCTTYGLIMKVDRIELLLADPSGKEVFGCVSLPKGAGKTEFATMIPTLPGWKVPLFKWNQKLCNTLLAGADAWRRCGVDSAWTWRQATCFSTREWAFRLRCQFHSWKWRKLVNGRNWSVFKKIRNIRASFQMLSKNAILVNCASTNKGRFYWEGLGSLLSKEERISDWKRENWSSDQMRWSTNFFFTWPHNEVIPNLDCQHIWTVTSLCLPVRLLTFILIGKRVQEYPSVCELYGL